LIVAPASDPAASARIEALSVILDFSDAPSTGALVQAIRQAAGDAAIEFQVRISHLADPVRAELDRIFGANGWSAIPRDADLRDVAQNAQHATLLTLSDRIRLADVGVLHALCSLLQADDSVGSSSCVLLAEKVIKRETVLQPAAGGLFPSRVSFVNAPRLTFSEPDVLQALPDLTYPVVANTLLLTAFRTSALACLPRPQGPVPPSGADIRLGLDLMAAGYGNWCTTRVAAQLAGPYDRRDTIDPVGTSYLEPHRWEDILRRVTLVRELL
jgi:hypothetical protein